MPPFLLRPLALLALIGAAGPLAAAQSPLAVSPGTGTLNDAISGDTDRPADRVYVLERGGTYAITEAITNEDYTLRIHAADGEGVRPVVYADGGGSRFLQFQNDASLRGIYLSGVRSDSFDEIVGIPVAIDGEGMRLDVDDSVFEGSPSRFFEVNGADTKLYFRDSQFRNFVRPDNVSNGRAIDYRDVVGDTLFIQNTTFMNVTGFIVRVNAARLNSFTFNHNTVHTTLNDLTNSSFGLRVVDATITNNLFVNVNGGGQAPEEDNGFIRLDAYEGGGGFFESDRDIVISNNAYTTSPEVLAYYQARTDDGDPLVPYNFLHPTAQDYIDDNDGAVAENNVEQSVEFVDPPSLDGYIEYLTAVRTGAPELPFWWFGDVEGIFPAEQPIPEDLAYDESSPLFSASSEGLPLGDLNWFPAQRAIFGTAVDDAPAQAGTFAVRGVFPNPSTDQATVRFDLAAAAAVSVDVFDTLGRRVLAASSATFGAGVDQRVSLDTQRLAPGLYAYRVTAITAGSAETQSGRLTVVR